MLASGETLELGTRCVEANVVGLGVVKSRTTRRQVLQVRRIVRVAVDQVGRLHRHGKCSPYELLLLELSGLLKVVSMSQRVRSLLRGAYTATTQGSRERKAVSLTSWCEPGSCRKRREDMRTVMLRFHAGDLDHLHLIGHAGRHLKQTHSAVRGGAWWWVKGRVLAS